VGIVSITKTSTDGLIDTYTITYGDGSESTFTVTNGAEGEQGIQGIQGEQGEQGEKGEQGETGVGIVSIVKTSTDGLIDTYTITCSDGSQTTFTVANGAKGDKGEQGIQGEQGPQGEQGIQGEKGDQGDSGLSAYEIYLKYNPSYTGTEAEWIEAYITGTLTQYTVTFNLNGGTAPEGFESSIIANYGKTIALCVPTREGYTFNGWYTGETAVDGIFTTTDIVTGDLSLVAKWTINKVTVTFLDYYGDIVSVQTIDYGSAAEAPALPAEINGIPFYGWNKSFSSVTEDMTVSALYLKETYTVTYDTDGGTEIAAEGVYYGDIPTKPADPVKPGFSFGGWFLDRAFTQAYNFDYALDANTTIYAKMNGDYIFITTAEELAAIADAPNEKYILGNDINFKGDIWTPIESFSGTLDGNGHKIYNFLISDTSDRAGFVRTNSGVIKNLVFDEFSFSVNHSSSSMYAQIGIIAGTNSGTIENCRVISGTVNFSLSKNGYGSQQRYASIGGLVGENDGRISSCTNTANLTIQVAAVQTKSSQIESWLDYSAYIGGIVGANRSIIEKCEYNGTIAAIPSSQNGGMNCLANIFAWISGGVGHNQAEGTITECFVNADITSDSSGKYKSLFVGGIVSSNEGTLSNASAIGTITINNVNSNLTNGYIAGAVSKNNGSIKNVYADVDITATTTVTAAASLVAQQFSGSSVTKSYAMSDISLTSATHYAPILCITEGVDHLCYYSDSIAITLNGTSAEPTNTSGTAKTLSELQSEEFIYNTLYWDNDIWHMVDGENPTLKCFMD